MLAVLSNCSFHRHWRYQLNMNSCFTGFIMGEEGRHKQDACNDYFYCQFDWISEATEMWKAKHAFECVSFQNERPIQMWTHCQEGVYIMEHVWTKWMYVRMSVCRHQETRKGLWEGKIATLRVGQRKGQDMWHGCRRDDIKVQRTWVE